MNIIARLFLVVFLSLLTVSARAETITVSPSGSGSGSSFTAAANGGLSAGASCPGAVAGSGCLGDNVGVGYLSSGYLTLGFGATIATGGSAGVIQPGVIRGSANTPLDPATVPTISLGPGIQTVGSTSGVQIQQCTWTASVATCTLRSGQNTGYFYGTGDWANISGMAAGYNGDHHLSAASIAGTTVSFPLAANPGTSTVSYGLMYVDPGLVVQANAPFGTAAVFVAHPSCILDGNDAGAPIVGIMGAAGAGQPSFMAAGTYWGCDGHTEVISFGDILLEFLNGFEQSAISTYNIAWTSCATSATNCNPAASGNWDTNISRIAPGVVGAGTGVQGSTAGTFSAASFIGGGNAGIATETFTINTANAVTGCTIVVTAGLVTGHSGPC
jgi:hypothetical protein